MEDVALAYINDDGYLDVVAACETAHLSYPQSPGKQARSGEWTALIPDFSLGRGSWLRVFATDIASEGCAELAAANEGTADIVRLDAGDVDDGATSLIRIFGWPFHIGKLARDSAFSGGGTQILLCFWTLMKTVILMSLRRDVFESRS